jgi:8-oxo-dGTP diphosphatase
MGRSRNWSQPRVGASVLIRRADGTIALIRRLREPGAGRWAVPGGYVELGESVEDTVKREAKEETGLSVDDLSLLGVFDIIGRNEMGVTHHYISVCYKAGRVEGDLRAGHDVLEAGWFSPADLTEEMLTTTTCKILREAGIL